MISDHCFFGIPELTSVTILGTGVIVQMNAFAIARNLSELNLQDGDNVLLIHDGYTHVFSGCTKLPLATRARLVSMGFSEP